MANHVTASIDNINPEGLNKVSILCILGDLAGQMAEKVPPALKSVQPYLVVAKQFSKRDPIVAYYGIYNSLLC